MMKIRPIRSLVFLTALLGTSLAVAATPVKKTLESPKPGLHGQLSEYGGLRVLELWGDDEQAGYAQGYLLGADIRHLFGDYLLHPDILGDSTLWDQKALPAVAKLFEWPDNRLAELKAVYQGMHDAVGDEGMRRPRLGRPLTLEDLQAANAYADMWGFMCSSVSLWGPLTPDGETMTGRNLDFPLTQPMAQAQLIVIRHAPRARNTPSFVSVTWPGMIGVYTAMSDRGVTMLMHDANGMQPSQASGFTPRALILREALEAAQPSTFVDDVKRVFESRRVLIGNNIHVSTALKRDGVADDATPAAIFEYDGGADSGGVTVRMAASGEAMPSTALWCTNHMRQRRPAQECRRFEGLTKLVGEHSVRGTPVEPARLFEIMHEVRQPITLHTVVLRPAALEMFVRVPAITGDAPVQLELGEWFGNEQASWERK